MQLSVAVANAIAKVDELIALVKGKFTTWDNQVQSKINSLNKLEADFTDSAKRKYAGKDYDTIFVGTKDLDLTKDSNGDYLNASHGAIFEEEKDTFYPIKFSDLAWYQGATIWKISRASIHIDNSLHGNWYGSLMCEIHGHNSQSGHGADFTSFKYVKQSSAPSRGFIAKYTRNSTHGLILWLRGQCSYQISANNIPYTPVIYMNGLDQYAPLKLEDIDDTTNNIVID